MGCGGAKPAAAEQPSAAGSAMTEGALKQVKILSSLEAPDLKLLASKAESVTFQPSTVIIKQDDEGDAFYLIESGRADVDINGTNVATIGAGDFFGEMALIRNEPRKATVTAKEFVKTFKISSKTFTDLGLGAKLAFGTRAAVGAGSDDSEIKILPPSPKEPADVERICLAILKNKNLAACSPLEEAQAKKMSESMWLQEVAAGEAVITQGDLQAHYFYVVKSGNFEITVAKEGQSVEAAAKAPVGTLGGGDSFGELALIYTQARAATITAKGASQVWVLARPKFKEAIREADKKNAEANLTHIKNCPFIKEKNLADDKLKSMAESMKEMAFSQGETIFSQNEKGDRFYILVSGKVSMLIDDKEVKQAEGTASKAEYFGEKALESDAPRAATVKVTSESALTLYLAKSAFDMLLKGGGVAPAAGQANRFGNIKYSDLKELGLLGCGGFGAVTMVEHKTKSDEVYALKALSKGYVVKTGMQKSTIMEKNVQLMCESPFVVMLYETFNGPQQLFFLLELALGGELYATYNKLNLWGKVDHAKFYVAGTVFAFEHLHSKHIVYRDLKPENLLLTDEGRVKLTDMGLAKVCMGKTFTTCGTPDYFAPELIASKGHNQAVDWWTLGILTFELNVGHPPFESAAPMQIYAKVQKGINKVKFPAKAQGDIEKLVKALCTANPVERLPMKKGETQNIKSHAWFKGFEWAKMFDQTLTPPYKPKIKSKKDKSNFSARKEDMPPQVPYKDPKTGWDADFATSK